MICPFCDAPYSEKMLEVFDGTYGCESGCSYMDITVFCDACGKRVYVKGAFGETDSIDRSLTDPNWEWARLDRTVGEREIEVALAKGKEDREYRWGGGKRYSISG
jgi:hypothetical protein